MSRRFHCALAGATAAIVLAVWSTNGGAHPGNAGVTWTGSVARIVERRCASCHGANGTALPSLRDYDAARQVAQAVKLAVLTRQMPRWHAVRGFGDFSNDPSLTPHEVDLIAEWADAGAPYGDDAASIVSSGAPSNPDAADLVLTVPGKHRIRSSLQTFALPTGLEQDRWMRGWHFRPGNPAFVRGALLALDSGPTLGTWVPGDPPTFLPKGIAQRLPAGATIVLTVYYEEPAAPAVDASSVALHFGGAPERPLQHRALPCGVTAITEDIEALAIRSAVGKSTRTLRVTATRPDRSIEPLAWIEGVSSEHPQSYWFRVPRRLPATSMLNVDATHGSCGAELDYVAARDAVQPGRAPIASNRAHATEYACPMHPTVWNASPGSCPLCRMPLVPAIADVEGRYGLEADVVRDPAGKRPSTLRLGVREPRTNAIVQRFERVHERLFHLFVVSADLSEFSHIHPEVNADGMWEAPAPPMRRGMYHLFADFLPVGGTPQMVQGVLASRSVDGLSGRSHLVVDESEKAGRRLRVRLERYSGALRAGTPTFLAFALADPITGLPIRDLEPYLGAWGHMFILSDDLRDAVHSHPVTPLDGAGGPQVVFRQRFPRPGLYKLWVQFQRSGEVETVSFVIDVPAADPPLPTAP